LYPPETGKIGGGNTLIIIADRVGEVKCDFGLSRGGFFSGFIYEKYML
jgi:hypothetical protein